MVTGLNYFYDLIGIRKDAFKIYYDFNTVSGSDLVPSVSGGVYIYSGQIRQGLTLINGSGAFNGNNSIKISNVDALTGKNWSMFFVYEKTGYETGTLFSSLTTPTSNSGFEIGINDAHRLYFKYNTGAPSYYTFDQILARKNAVSVTLSDSYLDFDWYNFNTRRFESQSFVLRGNLLFPSNEWIMGVGFKGTIDDFIYLDGIISKNNRERLFSGFHSLLDLTSGNKIYVTGYENFQTGQISGGFKAYTTGHIFYTGFLNHSETLIDINEPSRLNFFGDFTDDCNRQQTLYTYFDYTGTLRSNKLLPLTGQLTTASVISGAYFEVTSINSIEITGYQENSIPLFTGITGLNVLENVNVIDNCGNAEVVYTYENLTGVISGVEFIPLTGLIISYDSGVSNYKLGQFKIISLQLSSPRASDPRRVISFGYDAVTYLWNYESSDILEIVTFPNTENLQNFDKKAGFETVRGAAILDDDYATNEINFFLNGQLQQESGTFLTGVYNPIRIYEGDYYLDQNFAYSTGFDIHDSMYYDYPTNNVRGFRLVSGIISYPLNIGPAHQKNFFLNGQKLYTGSYILNGNNITLTGGYETLTGILNFYNKYNNEGSVTGVKTIITGRFPKDSSFIFQNGIRISDSVFVEHSSLDKISGSNIFLNSGAALYENTEDYWE